MLLLALVAPSTAAASFPGANGKIAFQTNRDGNSEVYAMNPDGSAQTNLTNNSAADVSPAWSADGSKIAFTRTISGGTSEVYVMNADGSGQTRITNNSASDFEPAWSPDGTKIAFARERSFGVVDIYVMNADGNNETRLTSTGLFDLYPAWSPDGSKIAFVRAIFGGTSEVYLMNADGSSQAQLSPSDGRLAQSPDWSPDGTKIAYGGGFGFGATADAYVINADGSSQTNLTPSTPASSDQSPAWSPDGTKIAFLSDRDANGEIYAMNADGSGQTNLTNNPAADDDPDWQPLLPDTTITGGPSGVTNDPTPTFTFSSEPGASFQCKVDAGSYAACASPRTTSHLTDGSHTFYVRAIDPADNPDPTPASRTFTVDATAPDTTIDSGPQGTTNDPTPSFDFSSSEGGSSFECKVDSGSYSACTSPRTTSHLTDGSHTFRVRATDTAGNVDATPASRTFAVETAAVSVSGLTLVVTAAPGAKDNLAITQPSISTLRVTDLASGALHGLRRPHGSPAASEPATTPPTAPA